MFAKSILLKQSMDEGIPSEEDFQVIVGTEAIDPETLLEKENGGLVVQLLCLSPDPFLRGQMRTGGLQTPGRPIRGYVSGVILASSLPEFSVGDYFGSNLPFVTIQHVKKEHVTPQSFRNLTKYCTKENISHGIGVLGMPGATAYGGLFKVLEPKQGETIWVSAISGAVGGLVAELARNVVGAKVIGSAGGTQKCESATNEFKLAGCVDYKSAHDVTDLTNRVKAISPDGIDMYFDNVGGMHLEAALSLLKPYGRVAICGAIAEYNSKVPKKEEFFFANTIYRRLRIQGFVSVDYMNGKYGDFLEEMALYLKQGKITARETHFNGIESWPKAFIALFSGANLGKVVVNV